MSVFDAVDEEFFDDDLVALTANFDEWGSTDGRGTHLLWTLLGRVHELASKTDQNTAARHSLEQAVKKVPSVQASNRWKTERKTTRELLLTILLGLDPERKATKSQWFAALKAAELEKIPPSQEAVVEWLKEIGGVQAARKLVARPTEKPNFDKEIEYLENRLPEDYISFAFPTPSDADDFRL